MPGRRSNSSVARQEPFVRRRRHDVPIAVRVFARVAASCSSPRAIDTFRRSTHVRPGLAAEGAGVHRQRAAERAGNAGEEFRGAEAPLDALAREPRARHAGLARTRSSSIALERDRARRASTMTTPRMPPSRTSRLLPSPSQNSGTSVGQRAQEREQVGAIARAEEDVRGSAHVPGRVARHRLVALARAASNSGATATVTATSRRSTCTALPPGRGGPELRRAARATPR